MNLSIVAALALAACGGAQTSAATDEGRDEHSAHAAHAQGAGGMAGMCPMMVEGTTVVAEETEGGAALVFTTSGDVDELRRRVDPGELPALREHVGRMAEQMSARECPMMARREASQ